MGLNCKAYIPTDVSGYDAIKVVGILAGLPSKRVKFDRSEGHGIEVHGTNLAASPVADGMTTFSFEPGKGKKLVDNQESHTCTFHYGARKNGKIWNLLYPASTPFWCAVMKETVEWFGGILFYNDCSEKKNNFFKARRFCPVDRYKFVPDDGAAWERYVSELAKMVPVTSLALRRATRVAGYADSYEKDGITEKNT